MTYHRLITTVLGLATALAAQDPVPPPGGFDIKLLANLPITYSDSYKTLLDVRYPDNVVPAAQGWPCALVVHGGGGNRKKGWVVTIAEMLTRAGYVTLAYDTGGNGATIPLNPLSPDRVSPQRIRDLAEIIHFAEGRLGNLLDERRLAIMGKSGGGMHTLWAASYSGRALPLTSALVTTMPVFRAAHTDIQVINFLPDHLPQGRMIRSKWLVDTVRRLGPADPLSQLLLTRNYAALTNVVKNDPGKGFFPLLKQSDVPLFVSYAYDDKHHDINVNADALPLLKSGVPNRYFQATGGHGSANNNIEGALRRDYTKRWFNRFLKNIRNDVENEPFAEIAVIPNDAAEYGNANSEWKHRQTDTWSIAPTRRLYLRGNSTLDPGAPTAIEAGPTIQHRVANGYTTANYVQDDGNASAVLNKIPLVTAGFETAEFPEPTELFGRAIVEIDVINSLARDFQLQAALLDVPPSGPARFITSGVSALRNATPGRHRMRIAIGDTAYVLKKGHKLRLSLENLNLRRQPGNPHIFVVPDLDDCDIAVQIDPAFAPRVDLPLRAARASLTPRFGRVSAASGINYELHVRGESSRAGDTYLVLAGASGTTPGTNLPPHIPLNFDIATTVGLDIANTAAFQTAFGLLNVRGRGKATLNLPAPIANALVGTRLVFATVTLSSSNQFSVTNPVELIIEP